MAGWLWTRKAISGASLWIVFGVVIVVVLGLGIFFSTQALGTREESTTLRVALPTFGAEVLDPSMDYQAGHRYYGHMFDHLLGATRDGKPDTEHGALEGWSSSPDGRSYTLVMKESMTWHDDVEVTADDLKFSLGHYARAAAACATCGALDAAIKEMRLIDRYRLAFDLNQPDFAFITRLGPIQEDIPLLPSLYWQTVGEAGFAEKPIGSGPWKFAKRAPGDFVEYDANLDYWITERVPAFSGLRLVLVPDRKNRLAMLRTDVVDMTPVGPGDIASLKAEGFAVQGPKYIIETALRFFMSYDQRFLTADQRFRKALILGMNLPPMVESVYPPEAATLASGSAMFSPVTQGFDPDLPPYPYDPDLARELLRQSGYAGETIRFLSIPVYDLTETPLLNQLIAQSWKEIGVNVEIVPTTYAPVKARFLRRPQEFDDVFPAPVFHGGHVNRPGGIINAIFRYMTTSEAGLLSYHDPKLGDGVYADLMGMPDLEARQQRLKELNRQLYEEYWAAPIVWRHEVWGLRPNLDGWRPTNGTDSDLNFETVRSRD